MLARSRIGLSTSSLIVVSLLWGGCSSSSSGNADAANDSAKTDLASETVADLPARTSYDSPSVVDTASSALPQDASPDACVATGGALPDLTTGYWVYYNCTDSVGNVWDGSNLTFNSVSAACGGATLTATMNWFSSNGQYSTTESYIGTYVSATRQVTWNGQDLANSHGGVVLENDVATYDPSTDQLVNGSWVGGHPGTFTARHVINAGSAPGSADAGLD